MGLNLWLVMLDLFLWSSMHKEGQPPETTRVLGCLFLKMVSEFVQYAGQAFSLQAKRHR